VWAIPRRSRLRRHWKHNKVFVVGRAKTGTTTLSAALDRMGFVMGNQRQAELLVDEWRSQRFESLLQYVKTADAFQDAPFGFPGTFRLLDQAFPDSKFILSVRDPEQWFASLVNHHASGVGLRVDLENFARADDEMRQRIREWSYVNPGWVYRNQLDVNGAESEEGLYDREIYLTQFRKHNDSVREYFRDRADDLLELDVSQHLTTDRLVSFLGLPSSFASAMPRKNVRRTS